MKTTTGTRTVDTGVLENTKKHLDEGSWGTIWITFRLANQNRIQNVINSALASKEEKALAQDLLTRIATLEKQGSELQKDDAVRLIGRSSDIRKGAIGWIFKIWDHEFVQVHFIGDYSRTVHRLMLEKIVLRPDTIAVHQYVVIIEDTGTFKKGSVVQVTAISEKTKTAVIYCKARHKKNRSLTVPLSVLAAWQESHA